MNIISIYTFKILRKIYSKIINTKEVKPECEQDSDSATKLIYDALANDGPYMIARFGSTELTCLSNYLGVCNENKSVIAYVKNEASPWWWEKNTVKQMQDWSGFFPAEIPQIEKFCKLMLQDIPKVDILGSWLANERLVDNILNAKKIHLRLLEPFWSDNPWTRALKDKKVLIIHPFVTSIQNQYNRRDLLFKNRDILPTFKSITVIEAVQSLGEGDSRFVDWFQALDYMKSEMDKVDYDVCLIGAGAYGFHLAAHAKRKGKKGIHIGGALQLLFGIRGKRWEDPNYGVEVWDIPSGFYPALMNEYWIRPQTNETPISANNVEGACYW